MGAQNLTAQNLTAVLQTVNCRLQELLFLLSPFYQECRPLFAMRSGLLNAAGTSNALALLHSPSLYLGLDESQKFPAGV